MHKRLYARFELFSIVLSYVLFSALFILASASLSAVELDRFWIVSGGAQSGASQRLLHPVFQPGESFTTLFRLRDLDSEQGLGSVTWNFRYYVNGQLRFVSDTETYSSYQEGLWSFERRKDFTISSDSMRGKHRIDLFFKDNVSGRICQGEVNFSVQGRPFQPSQSQEAAVESYISTSAAYRTVWLKDVSVQLSSVHRESNQLVCTFLARSYGKDTWLGFEDGYIIDDSGKRHEAMVGGLIRSNGWGGLDLVAGISMKGSVYFDAYASDIRSIQILDIEFGGKEKGRWENIPVPLDGEDTPDR